MVATAPFSPRQLSFSSDREVRCCQFGQPEVNGESVSKLRVFVSRKNEFLHNTFYNFYVRTLIVFYDTFVFAVAVSCRWSPDSTSIILTIGTNPIFTANSVIQASFIFTIN